MGAAELAALLKDYRGSYILTFAGYNAGRGRVQQWVAQRGDPRDPGVDAVDWVERIKRAPMPRWSAAFRLPQYRMHWARCLVWAKWAAEHGVCLAGN